MELHPILERGAVPSPGLWYVIPSCEDRCPTMRVGHTATQIGDKIYVIGGANPSGSFSDVYILDLTAMTWDTVDCHGSLKARFVVGLWLLNRDDLNKTFMLKVIVH